MNKSASNLDMTRRVKLGEREFIILGTAHVSQSSIDDVKNVIAEEKPDRVCIELDEARWNSMKSADSWSKMDIVKVIKEGKAFLLLANLVLSSFQKKMGAGANIKPGAEMLAAVEAAEEAGIAWSLCDRDVQTTLRRAWGKSNFWNKSKLLAQLLASAFSSEKLKPEDIEKLKEQSELDSMMAELADYLPGVKEVLIDERDRYLASKIWESSGNKIVAVIGAGHSSGVEAWLKKLGDGEVTSDTSGLETIPPKSLASKAAGYIVPALIIALLVLGFVKSGTGASLALLVKWLLLNGSLAALGSLLCLAHPLTILVSFIAAPIGTLHPLIAVGFFSGLTEAWLRKPEVKDLENLNSDITSFRGFYRNRLTHILLIFFLSSLGGAIGNFIALPFLFGGAL